MNKIDEQFYNLVFPFRRVFSLKIDDLEKLKTEGYWTSVNFGFYYLDLKIRIIEPPDFGKQYLSAWAMASVKGRKLSDHCKSICIQHRLHVVNKKKTYDDHVTKWVKCIIFKGKQHTLKIMDWSSLMNNGFAENGSISLEWELDIRTECLNVKPFFCYSLRTLRVHKAWNRPVIQRVLKVQPEKFEKDVLIEGVNPKVNSLGDKLQITAYEDNDGVCISIKSETPNKHARMLLEASISHRTSKWYTVQPLAYDFSSDFRIQKPELVNDLQEKIELHFEIYLHALESPNNEISIDPRVNDDHEFLVFLPSIQKSAKFFKSVLMSYSKFVHNFFTKRTFSQQFSSTKSTGAFFRKLKSFDEFKLHTKQDIEKIFFSFALLVHNDEIDLWYKHVIKKETIEDLLLLIKVLDSPEGFRRCDAIMTRMKFESDLKILKLVAQYPLPQMKTIYKKKYQDNSNLRNAMQVDDFFKSLPPDFLQDLAKIHQNEIECDITLRYDSSDSNLQVERDQVVFSFFKTGEKYKVNKMILAIATEYFWMRFLGPHSNIDDKYVVFDDVIPEHFETFLNHVYHPTNPITHHNFDVLLRMAHRFGAQLLLKKLERFLVFNENYSLAEKLVYANDFDLVFVLEFCLNSVKCFDDLDKLKTKEKFIQLPVEFKQFVQENIRWRIVTFK